MRNKLVYCDYNVETGISTVVIQNKYGHFTGKAKLHESDADHPSKFQGCEYAEQKAMIECLEKRISILKVAQKALLDCHNEMKQSPHFNKESFEAKNVRKQIWRKTKEIVDLTGEKEYLKKRMEATIAERDISKKHLDKHRKKLQQMGKKD